MLMDGKSLRASINSIILLHLYCTNFLKIIEIRINPYIRIQEIKLQPGNSFICFKVIISA